MNGISVAALDTIRANNIRGHLHEIECITYRPHQDGGCIALRTIRFFEGYDERFTTAELRAEIFRVFRDGKEHPAVVLEARGEAARPLWEDPEKQRAALDDFISSHAEVLK